MISIVGDALSVIYFVERVRPTTSVRLKVLRNACGNNTATEAREVVVAVVTDIGRQWTVFRVWTLERKAGVEVEILLKKAGA